MNRRELLAGLAALLALAAWPPLRLSRPRARPPHIPEKPLPRVFAEGGRLAG